MSTFDYGNYGKRAEGTSYQPKVKTQDLAVSKQAESEAILKFGAPKETELSSLEAMSNYALGALGVGNGKGVDVSALGLSENDQKLISRYVTPEQQARIESGMLSYLG